MFASLKINFPLFLISDELECLVFFPYLTFDLIKKDLFHKRFLFSRVIT